MTIKTGEDIARLMKADRDDADKAILKIWDFYVKGTISKTEMLRRMTSMANIWATGEKRDG